MNTFSVFEFNVCNPFKSTRFITRDQSHVPNFTNGGKEFLQIPSADPSRQLHTEDCTSVSLFGSQVFDSARVCFAPVPGDAPSCVPRTAPMSTTFFIDIFFSVPEPVSFAFPVFVTSIPFSIALFPFSFAIPIPFTWFFFSVAGSATFATISGSSFFSRSTPPVKKNKLFKQFSENF